MTDFLSPSVVVELQSAVGPRVTYQKGVDASDVDAEIPAGWQVDYSSQVETTTGWYACPLVRA